MGIGEFTQREREVADLVARGMHNKQIGRELNISVETVKEHVHNCLVAGEFAGRTELAVFWSLAQIKNILDGFEAGVPPQRVIQGAMDAIYRRMDAIRPPAVEDGEVKHAAG